MVDIKQYHSLDDFIIKGNFPIDQNTPSQYRIRVIRDLSVVNIVAFDAEDPDFKLSVKSVLGLIVPPKNSSYVAGTRTILSLDNNKFMVSTEGEARHVLHARLSHALADYAGVFETSAAYVTLRIDGYHFYRILSTLISDTSLFIEQDNYCSFLQIDSNKIILFRQTQDVVFLYLPPSIAPELYRRIARYCFEYGVYLA